MAGVAWQQSDDGWRTLDGGRWLAIIVGAALLVIGFDLATNMRYRVAG